MLCIDSKDKLTLWNLVDGRLAGSAPRSILLTNDQMTYAALGTPNAVALGGRHLTMCSSLLAVSSSPFPTFALSASSDLSITCCSMLAGTRWLLYGADDGSVRLFDTGRCVVSQYNVPPLVPPYVQRGACGRAAVCV